MDIVKPGVVFELKNLEADSVQTIRFVEKVAGKLMPGTTNEEVIQMMIERFYHLQKEGPSVENQMILMLLKDIRRTLVRRQQKKFQRKQQAGHEKEVKSTL